MGLLPRLRDGEVIAISARLLLLLGSISFDLLVRTTFEAGRVFIDEDSITAVVLPLLLEPASSDVIFVVVVVVGSVKIFLGFG